MTIVVCGPMACGKTSNSARLQRRFGLDQIVDDFDPRHHKIEPDAIHLTNVPAAEVRRRCGASAKVFEYSDLRLPDSPRERAAARCFVRARSKRWG